MLFERLAVLIGGFAAGALLRNWRDNRPAAVSGLKAQLRAQEHRIKRLEARTDTHDAKLEQIPTQAELVSALDELLAKAVCGLDARLTAQARSIEALQNAVTQTDELLERVLESLDTLRDA